MMTPKHMYVLRSGKHTVGFVDRSNAYVLGFFNQTHAFLVRKHLSFSPSFKFDRTVTQNEQVQNPSTEVNMYLDATMTFAKVENPEQNNANSSFTVSSIAFEDFLTLPFQKNTGVAMPYEILEENEKGYKFRVQIIDPLSL